MKMRIDAELCTGHGRCARFAPHVFRLDDNGFNADCGQTLTIAPEYDEEAAMGMKSCPERAITIIDE